MKKQWFVVFKTETGKELAAYTAAHTFPGEAENTRALLAYENGLQPEEIIISMEER